MDIWDARCAGTGWTSGKKTFEKKRMHGRVVGVWVRRWLGYGIVIPYPGYRI
jgi:hypothetical protein